MVAFLRNMFRRSLTALFIACLSIAVLLISPSVPPTLNNLSVIKTLPNTQKLDASSEILAATNSLESGHGPSGFGTFSCLQNALMSASCATPAAGTSPLLSAASAQGWTELAAAHPSASFLSGIAYDAFDGYVVLFGGVGAAGLNGETWKFSSGSWTQLTPSSGPSARAGGGMAYDVADGYVILFGGLDSTGRLLRDTWKFSNGAWTNITSADGPSPRIAASMAYDALPADRYTVLFGGTPVNPTTPGRLTSALRDTWRFSGGTWTNITTVTGPSARAGASISFDPADGYLLLFGGQSPTAILGDTWKFSSGSWTSISTSTDPGRRVLGSMSYDATIGDDYLVLFGGANVTSITSSQGYSDLRRDTWKFSAGSWTNITTATGPVSQFGSPIVFDAGQGAGYVLFFSTDGLSWKFSAGVWTSIITPSPSLRASPSMVYDAADGYVILFGGTSQSYPNPTFIFFHDTWKFQAGVWTNITVSGGPTPRAAVSMAYDAADGYVVLFGGFAPISTSGAGQAFGLLHDTWKFSAGSWTNITVTPSPPARDSGAATYDAADNYLLLFGGVGGATGGLKDTWKFSSGVWTNITSSSGPSARSAPSVAYDTADGYVVLFGGANPVLGYSGDTWTWGPVAGTKTTSTSLLCFLTTIDIGQTSECQVYVYDSSGTGTSTPTGTILLSQTGISTGASFAGNPCTLTAPQGGAATCSVTFSSTSTGVASITAVYSGDTGYAASTSTSVDVTVTIAAHQTTAAISCSPNPVLAGVYSTCTATVTDTSTSRATTPTGQVTMSFQSPAGGKANELCTLSGTGATASCSGTIAYLAAFTANIQAAYAGDTGPPAHYGSTGSTILTATARPTTTTLTCIPASVNTGSATTCTASVTDNAPISTGLSLPPTGTVGFTTSGTATFATSCTLVAVTTATALCSVTYTPTGTSARTDTITANYVGDSTHATSSYTFSLDVTSSLDSTSTTVSCTPSRIVLGQTSSCTATVTDTSTSPTMPTGTVAFQAACYYTCTASFTASPCTLTAGTTLGTATCIAPAIFSSTSIGAASVTGTYNGDSTHAMSSGTEVSGGFGQCFVLVNQWSVCVDLRPTATVISCPATGTVNLPTSCSATVTDYASGTGLVPGGWVSFFVTGGTVTFSMPPNPLIPPGVCVLQPGTGLTSSCSISLTPDSAGTLSVYGIYAPLGSEGTFHNGSTSNTLTIIVTSALNPTSTAVTCASPVVIGQASTCTITVTDTSTTGASTPTGFVAFAVSGITGTLPNCNLAVGTTTDKATCTSTFTSSTAGTATITASYNGDTTHSTSTSLAATVTVNLRTTGTAVFCSPSTIVIGQAINCTATVTDSASGTVVTPTGTVNFGPTLSCRLTSGTVAGSATCSVQVTPDAVGLLVSVGADYPGDRVHSGSRGASNSIMVSKRATSITINCLPSTLTVGQPTTCTFTVSDTDTGTAITPTGTVTMSTSLTCTLSGTGSSAECTITTTPPFAGASVNIPGTYGGDTNHSGKTGSTTITLNRRPTPTSPSCPPSSVITASAPTCTATVTDSSGIGPASTPQGFVTFTFTTPTGVVTFTSSPCTLAAGTATATASCSVQYTPSSPTAETETVTATYCDAFNCGSNPFPIHATSTGTAQVSVTSPSLADFTISANPTSLTLSAEGSENCRGGHETGPCDDEGQVTITVAALNGFTGQVSLSVSSSPRIDTELSKSTIDTSGTW